VRAFVGLGERRRPAALQLLLTASSLVGGYVTGPRIAELQEYLKDVTFAGAWHPHAVIAVAEKLAEVAAGAASISDVAERAPGHVDAAQATAYAEAILLGVVVMQSTRHEASDLNPPADLIAGGWCRSWASMVEWVLLTKPSEA
jgi:hypothetical protein